MNTFKRSLYFVTAAALSAELSAAEWILTNGKIVTVDPEFNIAQAIAIDKGSIVAVGSEKAIASHIKPESTLIDLKGKMVIPGLIDNHMHLVRGAQNWRHQIRLEAVLDYKEALQKIKEVANRSKPGEWLMVPGGFVERQFAGHPEAGFLRTDLDRAAPDNPVYLQHLFDWGYANSKALEQIGVNPNKPDPMPGLLLDQNGLPQGPVTKRAQWLIEQKIDEQKKQNQLTHVSKALNDLARAGLTTVVDAGGFNTTDNLYEPFVALDEAGEMPIRLYYMKQVVSWGDDERVTDLSRLDGVKFQQGSEYFRPVAVGEQLYLPVQDTAGRPAKHSEAVKHAFKAYATELAKREIPLHLHAVNDQSINQHLSIFEEIDKEYPLAKLRWTLAHVDGIKPETIGRAKKLGIVLAIHSRPILIGYRFQSRFGPAARKMTPMREITDQGVLWGLGSDSPTVSIYNPFRTLWWAVSGQMIDGTDVTRQVVNRKEALIAHTINNARLVFAEDKIGSLEVGKQADLVVLNEDYLKVGTGKIAKIRPVATMLNGRWIFRSEHF